MNRWIVTDTHFGHANLKQYCGRPDNFEQLILYNIQRVVKPTDILIHLGDICLGHDDYWHKQLQKIICTKWLIRGNHDRQSTTWYLQHGWGCVADGLLLTQNHTNYWLTHKPSVSVTGVNIHGHEHNNITNVNVHTSMPVYHILQISLSMENNQYKPFLFNRIAVTHQQKGL